MTLDEPPVPRGPAVRPRHRPGVPGQRRRAGARDRRAAPGRAVRRRHAADQQLGHRHRAGRDRATAPGSAAGWPTGCDPAPARCRPLVLAGIATAVTLPVVRYAGEVLRGGAAGGGPAAHRAGRLPARRPARRRSPRWWSSSSSATCGGPARWWASCPASARWARSPPPWSPASCWWPRCPAASIMLGLAVLLGGAGIALGWYLRRQDPSCRCRASRRTRAALAVVGLVGAGLTAVAPNPCDVETAYHCARGRRRPAAADRPGADAQLGPALVRRPGRPDAPGVRVHPVDRGGGRRRWPPAGQPVDALHLGGGGFTVPRYLTRHPAGQPTTLVLELDGDLVELDRRELGRATRARRCGWRSATPGCGLAEQPDASADLRGRRRVRAPGGAVAPGHPGDGRRRRAGCCGRTASTPRTSSTTRRSGSSGPRWPPSPTSSRTSRWSRRAGRAGRPRRGANFVIVASESPAAAGRRGAARLAEPADEPVTRARRRRRWTDFVGGRPGADRRLRPGRPAARGP